MPDALLGGKHGLIIIPLDALSFRDYKCFGFSIWLTCLLRNFSMFSLNLL